MNCLKTLASPQTVSQIVCVFSWPPCPCPPCCHSQRAVKTGEGPIGLICAPTRELAQQVSGNPAVPYPRFQSLGCLNNPIRIGWLGLSWNPTVSLTTDETVRFVWLDSRRVILLDGFALRERLLVGLTLWGSPYDVVASDGSSFCQGWGMGLAAA